MRVLLILLALGLLGLGFAFGALNPAVVPIDLFGLTLAPRLGLALLVAALLGALAAGLLLGTLVMLPLRRRLRRAEAELKQSSALGLRDPARE